MENRVSDWSRFASHELSLDEVRAMTRRTDKYTGFADGMFISKDDDAIALRFLHGHGYEAVTRALWRHLCKGGIAVDVGTHSGVFSLDAWRSGAELVFSCEPNPINYARMVLNLRANGFPSHGAFYGAIGEKNKIGMFHVADMHFVSASGEMDRKSRKGETIPVRVMRLDGLIPRDMLERIHVVKIDAENYTPNVIDGMSGIFEVTKPDLIVEASQAGLTEKLKFLGYRFWRIWESGTIEEVQDIEPYNPDNNYNGTHEYCRNRFASVRGLPTLEPL